MKEHKKVIRFLISALGICLTWFVVYDIWLSDYDDWLTLKIADASVLLLNLAGYEVETSGPTVLIDGKELVNIGPGCNGMVLMALFTGFIIAFPGPVLKKVIYISFGILIINLLNVIRVATLALNAHYSMQTLEFNHKYTFTLVVYASIFGLWMLWVKKFSKHNNYIQTPSHEQQAA